MESNSEPGRAGVPRWQRAVREGGSLVVPPAIPWWKRAIDLGAILIFSPGILPVCAGVALLVKLGSKGPVLFKQRRVGFKGKEFTIYKFRTMRRGAETQSHKNHTQQLIKSRDPMVKLDNQKDPRVIPFGRLLRAGGLDELPQLINVLRGEMSVVGPRPCIPYEYEMYEPWHHQRLETLPGLTGLWQVSGKNRTTFEQMVKLDIEYANRKSFWLDVKIILRTPLTIWAQYCELRAVRRKTSAPRRQKPPALERWIPSFRL